MTTSIATPLDAKRCEPADAWRVGKVAWQRIDGPRRTDREKLHWIKRCVGEPQRAARKWQNARERFRPVRREKRANRRQRRRAASLTPYNCGVHGRFAIPCTIVDCESDYNIRARNPYSSAGGYGQAIRSTWIAFGGTPYRDSHPAAVAPKSEQDRVFAAIYADGDHHWDASRHCWGY